MQKAVALQALIPGWVRWLLIRQLLDIDVLEPQFIAVVLQLDWPRHRQRTALELHQFEDRTYAEVAAELDMTPKAAKSLLYRARNQLRESLTAFMS